MTGKERNALAELAEQLAFFANDYSRVPTVEELCGIGKASRIITELAKVEDVVYKASFTRAVMVRPNTEQAITSVRKCRAIAKERTEDGK